MAGYNVQGAVDALALNVGRTAAVVAGVTKQANDKKVADEKMLEQTKLQNETNSRLAQQQDNLEILNRLQMKRDVYNDIEKTKEDKIAYEQDRDYYRNLFDGENWYDALKVAATDNKFKMLHSREEAIKAQEEFNKARKNYVEFGHPILTSDDYKKLHKDASERVKNIINKKGGKK